MQWSPDADAEIRKVPFFVRKKVRARVEKEARDQSKTRITLTEIHATRKRFLKSMDSEIKGYQIDTCFGSSGCPNPCVSGDSLIKRLENLFEKEDLLGFLKSQVPGDLKFHHEFRVSLSQCPNACSQPQIKDIGIIGTQVPRQGSAECLHCFACTAACRETAIGFDPEPAGPRLDLGACLSCGACIRACPSNTLEEAESGYRVLLGGRLGRHPRLARELDGLFSEDQVIAMGEACLNFYKARSKNGVRFSSLLDDSAFDQFNHLFSKEKNLR